MDDAVIEAIYRYPVKGLSPDRLPVAALTVGQTIRGDRRFAIENGPSGFDPSGPGYLPKQRFLMLMKNERLARLDTRFDDATGVLTVRHGDNETQGDLASGTGRETIEAFFARYCADELRGPPKVLEAAGHSFSDVARKVVSIINLSSVAALEDIIGRPVDPLRFRANVYVEGWPAWAENGWEGRPLSLGEVETTVFKPIVRCAAPGVDPATAIRDLDIPAELHRLYGHLHCGIYVQVTKAGVVREGDAANPPP